MPISITCGGIQIEQRLLISDFRDNSILFFVRYLKNH